MSYRTVFFTLALGAALMPAAMLGEQRMSLRDLAVGRNLQVVTMIELSEPAPSQGMYLTLTSGDPSKLVLSNSPEEAGSATIQVKVLPQFVASATFWIQGLADQGQVPVKISAPGIGTAVGTVTLAPSAVVIRPSQISGTPRGFPHKIMLVTAMLSADRKVVAEQQVAAGKDIQIEIANSHPDVAKLQAYRLSVAGGASLAQTILTPSGLGKTTLSILQPHGFTTPSEMATLETVIEQPGIAGMTEVNIGKDLQLPASLCIGELAPPGGLKVTLQSSDPSQLLLSDKPDQVGSGSVTVTVPEGKTTAGYYVQALGDSGVVTYTASAPGFRSREHRIGLTPSGVIVAYLPMGPPDEAAVKRPGGQHTERRFYPSISESKAHPVYLALYTAYLDPVNGMAADITVQALRPGVNLSVTLESSDPAVGAVESPVHIKAGDSAAKTLFTPLSKGETVIRLKTPPGMTMSKNAAAVPASVRE